MRKILVFLFLLPLLSKAQQKTENLFIIMSDGLRWQEVFGGIDTTILNNKQFVRDKERLTKTFLSNNKEDARKKLLPFMWNTIATQGQIYGNRWKNSKMNVLNPYWFSYPGYNEVLSGYADDSINSNDKIYNKNVTVLEFFNQQPKLKNKVAAFTTWDVFPYIINDKRSGISVNSGLSKVGGKLSEKEELLNQIMDDYPSLASNRHDFITYYLAKEYLQKNKPKVMFISFDETDEFAHESKYDEYLFAANTFDKFLADLWSYCQKTPEYKEKTTFLIITDHGRGDANKSQWTSHGTKIPDCYQIWMAAIGPDTPALGEMTNTPILYQNQLAKTAADLLGYDFQNGKPIGEAIKGVKK
jgi:predicted AlkP superfamily pyrophosphatase or phosphodiesterase